jgi:hypothetical protein
VQDTSDAGTTAPVAASASDLFLVRFGAVGSTLMAPIQTTIVAYLAETDARALHATHPATASSTDVAYTHDLEELECLSKKIPILHMPRQYMHRLQGLK